MVLRLTGKGGVSILSQPEGRELLLSFHSSNPTFFVSILSQPEGRELLVKRHSECRNI